MSRTPRLSPEHEARWRALVEEDTRRAYRLGSLLAALLFLFGGPIDLYAPTEALTTLVVIRTVAVVVFLVLWRLAVAGLIPRRVQAASVAGMLFASAALSAMDVVYSGPGDSHYAAINLVVLAAALMFPWSAVELGLTIAGVLGVYAVTVLAGKGTGPLRLDLLIDHTYFLGATALLAVASAWQADHVRREAFELQVRSEADQERLADQDRLRRQFFASVSDDLRTPLALILGPVDALLARRSLDPGLRRELEVIDRNARALAKQVTDLLDVARLEAGHVPIRLAEGDLARLVRQVVERFRPAAAQRGVALVVEGQDTVPLSMDEGRMERIVARLLSNALRSSPDGGTVHVRVLREGADAVLRVDDAGPGIAPEHRARVFERFYPSDRPDLRRHAGQGLGLSIARDFVALHGGRITVDDAPGGGARFEARLPLRPPVDATLALPVAPEDPTEAALRQAVVEELTLSRPGVSTAGGGDEARPLVLLVEDNVDLAAWLADVLSDHVRVVLAHGADEALATARRTHPALVVTDDVLPGRSGLDLVRSLRNDPDLREVPAIVLTARTDVDRGVAVLGAGAQDYVVKPFPVAELLAKVEEHLRVAHARDVLRVELDTAGGDIASLAEEVGRSRHALHEALAEARAARDEATRALHVRDEFLSVASHELRNPLVGLHLQLEVVQRAIATLPPAAGTRLARSAANALAQVDRLRRLVDDMLDASRLGAGRLTITPAQMDLAELVREVTERARPQLDACGCPLELELPEHLQGTWDPARIEQVVENLVSNAAKYGAGHPVRVEADVEGGVAVLRVADQGVGIPAEDQARIFEAFERSARTTSIQGLGLGLYIVRQIVEAHHGRVSVESAPDRGSTFTVRLPREGADVTPADDGR